MLRELGEEVERRNQQPTGTVDLNKNCALRSIGRRGMGYNTKGNELRQPRVRRAQDCPRSQTQPSRSSRDLEQHVAVGARPVARLLAVGVRLRELRLEAAHLPEERALVVAQLE